MSKYRIALAHEFLNFFGGADQILFKNHEIFPDAPIYCLLADENFTDQYLPKAQIIPSYLNKWPRFITKKHQLFAFEFPVAAEQFDFTDFDIVLSDSHSFIKGIITKPSTVHVSYIHSPTRYLWDQNATWISQKKLNLLSWFINYRFNQIRLWDYLAADRVDLFLANSHHVAKRIKKYYRRDSIVVYPWVETRDFLPSTPVKKEDYYIILSRLVSFKNIDLAVQAFNISGKKLVVVGTGDEEKYLKSIAKPNIEFTGFVSPSEKVSLLQKAKAFVWTCEEDFGIVPVEAMAAGTPVIAYGVGGLTESVVSGQTGLFFHQLTPESVNETITNFEKNYQQFSPENCIRQAYKFDASVYCSNIIDIINRVQSDPQKISDRVITKFQ
ncbi:MAG TPA: glycosyltransferase [bacterium]|nr:glycosyltransferase [bacterium]